MSKWIEMYFTFKMIPFILISAFIIITILFLIYQYIMLSIKQSIMKKFGFKYDRGLGSNVAYEYQSHYVKGNIRIHHSEIDDRWPWSLYSWVKKNYPKEEKIRDDNSGACSSFLKNGKCKDTGKYCDACASEYIGKKEE